MSHYQTTAHSHSIIRNSIRWTKDCIAQTQPPYLPKRPAALVTDLLRSYLERGLIHASRNLFEEMTDRDVVAGYASCCHTHRAWAVFREMSAAGPNPNEHTLSSVLKACRAMGSVSVLCGTAVHAAAVKRGLEGSVYVSNALFDLYATCGADMEEACLVFRLILAKNSVSWTTFIAGYTHRGDGYRALRVFRRMLSEETKLSPFSFSIAASARALVRSHALGKQMHAAIIKHGFESDLPARNSILDMYCRCGCLSEANQYFNEMTERDLITWNTLVAGHERSDSTEALRIFSLMEPHGFRPNCFTFTTVMAACANFAVLHCGQQVHGGIIQRGLQGNLELANALIEMYAKCGKIADSCKIFNEMSFKDLVSWTSMVIGYGSHSYGREVVDLFNEMMRSGTKPDRIVFMAVLSACSHAGGHTLFPLVVTVFKTLNQQVACQKWFSDAVYRYGLSHSIYSFRIMVHTFGWAGMQEEVSNLLRDILCYYNESSLDMYDLFPALLDSPSCPERSSVVFDVLIKVLAGNSKLENALGVFVEAKRIRIDLSIRSCNFLLKCLAEANQQEFVKYLFEDMQKSGPLPNVYTYTIMINFYCQKCHGPNEADLIEATNILEEMEKNNRVPSVVTYSTYIRGLCSIGCVEFALNFIRDLRSRDCPTNSYGYNAIISGFCQKGRLDDALMVLEEMKTFRVLPDVYTYSILIDGFCKSGDLEKGVSVMKEMETNNIKPSLVSYSSLLKCSCEHGLIKFSLDLYQYLVASGYELDYPVYNILMNGCCKHGVVESIDKILKDMISKKMVPNVIDFNRIIHAFCKAGLLDKALEVYNIMLEIGVRPNTVTCNFIVDGYCREGYIEESLKLVDEMWDHQIIPNVYTYNAVINRLHKEKKFEKAWEVYSFMFKRSEFPCTLSYSALLDGFAKQSNISKALMVYTAMIKIGVIPNVVTYTVLMNLFCCKGRMSEAYNFFKEMGTKGLVPDETSYTTIISGFCRIGDMKKAWVLFKEMMQWGPSPNVITYTCLIDGFFKSDQMAIAKNLFDEMKRKNISPDVVTYTILISGYKRLGNMDKATEIFNEMMERGICPDDIAYVALGIDAKRKFMDKRHCT